ncbi:MAG: septation protein A [Gammaproteobacteria bacterium]|nr:MAG: septation protein A [Gammaproteobacteria bacterium]
MKFLYDYFPLILFFVAFKVYGIYTATAVAIAASFIQVGYYWMRHRRFENMHLVTLGVITVFGGLTLILHDDTFIKWKPTIAYWVLAIVFIGSHFIGKKTLLQRMLGKQIVMPKRIWIQQNIMWTIFFIVLGGLNIYVAFYYALDQDPETRTNTWVNFKLFGTLGLTVVFIVVQALFMAKHIQQKEQPPEEEQ